MVEGKRYKKNCANACINLQILLVSLNLPNQFLVLVRLGRHTAEINKKKKRKTKPLMLWLIRNLYIYFMSFVHFSCIWIEHAVFSIAFSLQCSLPPLLHTEMHSNGIFDAIEKKRIKMWKGLKSNAEITRFNCSWGFLCNYYCV